MNEWIKVTDRLPNDGQHVLVWEDRYNVMSADKVGDDGRGRRRMGDATFYSGQSRWNAKVKSGESELWQNDPEKYKEMNGWDAWKGQGPCSFECVTHWMPLPSMPIDANNPEPERIGFALSDKYYSEFSKAFDRLISNIANEIDDIDS